MLLLLVALGACSETHHVRPNTPSASPALFHVENDFIVVEIGIDGYSGNLRCLQRIDRFPSPLTGSFKDERCYWVPDDHDTETPGGLWIPK